MATNRGRPKGAKDAQQRNLRRGSTRLGEPAKASTKRARTTPERLSKRDRAAELIAAGRTVRDVAAEIDVPYSTLQRWMAYDEDFRDQLYRLGLAIREEVLRKIQARAVEITESLIKVALKGNKNDGPKVQAAKHALALLGIQPTLPAPAPETATAQELSDDELHRRVEDLRRKRMALAIDVTPAPPPALPPPPEVEDAEAE